MDAAIVSPPPSRNLVARADQPGAWAFLVIAFGISWSLWIVAIRLGAREQFLGLGSAGPALAALWLSRAGDRGAPRLRWSRLLGAIPIAALGWVVLAMYFAEQTGAPRRASFDPLLLAVALPPAWVLSGAWSSDAGIRAFVRRIVRRPDRWSLFALLCWPVFLLGPVLVARVLGQSLVHPPRNGSDGTMVVHAAVLFAYNLLFAAVLEEPGWRGFLLDRVQRVRSPLVASLLVWLPWALWHAPLDLGRPEPFSPMQFVLVRVVYLIPVTIILTWLYDRSARSTQAAVVFHGGMNTFPFVLPYWQPGLGLIFVWAAYAIVSGRMWRRTGTVSPREGREHVFTDPDSPGS